MDRELDERQKNIKEAKAALFVYLAEKHPHVACITACYSGGGDEGCIDGLSYFDAKNEGISLEDKKLADLIEHLFFYVTPEGFEINEGGDGKIHIYPAAQKVVVEHSQNIVTQEHETYEA